MLIRPNAEMISAVTFVRLILASTLIPGVKAAIMPIP